MLVIVSQIVNLSGNILTRNRASNIKFSPTIYNIKHYNTVINGKHVQFYIKNLISGH